MIPILLQNIFPPDLKAQLPISSTLVSILTNKIRVLRVLTNVDQCVDSIVSIDQSEASIVRSEDRGYLTTVPEFFSEDTIPRSGLEARELWLTNDKRVSTPLTNQSTALPGPCPRH